uniref:Proteasome assembly chaperone 1 n=1 Tax=Taeniopygia guttata TaxID=59729 RepID=A0A674GFS5_TAEGU
KDIVNTKLAVLRGRPSRPEPPAPAPALRAARRRRAGRPWRLSSGRWWWLHPGPAWTRRRRRGRRRLRTGRSARRSRRKAFLSSFILDSVCWEVVGVVKLWNEWCRTSSTTNVLPTDSFCLFYRLISDPTVVLCQCSCYVAEDQQFQWLEKVFGSMQKKDLQVTILSTCPVADYKTQESTLTLVSPFLKALKTKEFQEQVCCPLLEQPNIVRDLPAAVLSYCQVWQIPAVLYQCYTDVIKLDTVTIEAFKPLLSSQLLKSLAKDASESTKILKKFLTTSETHNNIYI